MSDKIFHPKPPLADDFVAPPVVPYLVLRFDDKGNFTYFGERETVNKFLNLMTESDPTIEVHPYGWCG